MTKEQDDLLVKMDKVHREVIRLRRLGKEGEAQDLAVRYTTISMEYLKSLRK